MINFTNEIHAPEGSKPLVDAIERLVAFADDPGLFEECGRLIRHHGEAFAAYLLAVAPKHTTATRIQQEFESFIVTSGASRADVYQGLIRVYGWEARLAEASDEEGGKIIDLLCWDGDAVREFFDDLFVIVDAPHACHVFDAPAHDDPEE